MREPEAKSRWWSSLFYKRQTLSSGATNTALSVCRLTLAMACCGGAIDAVVVARGGDGRADAHTTDAGVSICRSVFGGLASARASDAAPCLSIDRKTCLSWLSGGWERSGPRLSRDKRWSSLVSDASEAGSRPLDFERAVDTWRRLRATDARLASVGLVTDASVAPEICPVNC
jgi:hypothetical protein